MFSADFLDGKALVIRNLQLESANQQLTLFLDAYIAKKACRIAFCNVSSLQLAELAYPMQIDGFAVKDHADDGWDPDKRYEIYDFEDEKIRFFCEDISISEEMPQNEREASKKNKILFAFGCFVIAFFISFGVHVLMDYFLWETLDVLSELVDAAFNGSIFTFLAYCGKFKKKADNSSGFTPKAQ